MANSDAHVHTAVTAKSEQERAEVDSLEKPANYGSMESGTSKEEKSRDVFWDNCKGLGQLFVISLHLHLFSRFELLTDLKHMTFDNKLEHGYLMAIYCLTMPGYAFISGMLTPTSFSGKRLLGQAKYMALFLIHRVGYLAMMHPTGKKPIAFFQSSGVEWFLLSLVIWRALSPLIARLKWPITSSLLFALFIMMTDATDNINTNATCLFLPFFVLGLTMRGRSDELKQKRNSLTLRTAFIITIGLMMMSPVFDSRPYAAVISGMACFYGSSRFEWLRSPEFEMFNATEKMANPLMAPGQDYCQTYLGFANVLGLYALSAFMISGFATLVPNRHVWLLSKAGENSLYIYVCHSYLAIAPCRLGSQTLASSGYGPYPHIKGVLALVGMSTFFWWCLAGDWLKYVCFPFVDPPCEKLFVTEAV